MKAALVHVCGRSGARGIVELFDKQLGVPEVHDLRSGVGKQSMDVIGDGCAEPTNRRCMVVVAE